MGLENFTLEYTKMFQYQTYVQLYPRYTKYIPRYIKYQAAGPPRPARPRRRGGGAVGRFRRCLVFCTSWYIFIYLGYIWVYLDLFLECF